jgi:hypothetical protein
MRPVGETEFVAKKLAAPLSDSEKEALFRGTAMKVYRR